MTESAEEAVVSKTARVYEEVGLRKEATDRVETIRDTVRKEEVEVEQIPGTTTPRRARRSTAHAEDLTSCIPGRLGAPGLLSGDTPCPPRLRRAAASRPGARNHHDHDRRRRACPSPHLAGPPFFGGVILVVPSNWSEPAWRRHRPRHGRTPTPARRRRQQPRASARALGGSSAASSRWRSAATLRPGWPASNSAGIGVLHGLITWGIASLLTVYLLSSAVGGIIGGGAPASAAWRRQPVAASRMRRSPSQTRRVSRPTCCNSRRRPI